MLGFKKGIGKRKSPSSEILLKSKVIGKLWDSGMGIDFFLSIFQLHYFSLMARFHTELIGGGPVPFSCRVSSLGPLLRHFFLCLVPVAPCELLLVAFTD